MNSIQLLLFQCFRKTAAEYLEQVQKLVENENVTTNMSSYSIFLNLLGKVIKRLLQNDSMNAVMKIIGNSLNVEIHLSQNSNNIRAFF